MKQWGINLPMVDEFLRQTGKESTRSAQTYATSLRHFAAFCKKEKLEPLSIDGIVGYRGWLSDTKKDTTASSYAAYLNVYLNYLIRKRFKTDLDYYEANKILTKNNTSKRPWETVLRLDEIRFKDIPKLIEYFQDFPIPPKNDRYNHRLVALRDRALFWTFYDTWARVNEIRKLNRSHVLEGTHAQLPGKGRKPHTLIFDGISRTYILDYLREREDAKNALFVAHSLNASGKRLSLTGIHNAMKGYINLLGLDKSLSCHDIRHYQATRALRNDIPLHIIQDKLNHETIQTTRDIYAPVVGLDIIREKLSAMPYV